MRPPVRLPIAMAVAALLALACSGGPAASPVPPSVDPSPDAATPWLRAMTSQAIPPANLFAIGPTAVITDDGTYVTAGPMPAIYPSPALPNLVGRTITDAGRAKLMAEAARLGLLTGQTDFTGGAAVPGGMTGRIELMVDGRPVTLTGNPSAQIVCIRAPCDPAPGTPEAFGAFWATVAAPDALLGAELGPIGQFVADAYALLVGPAPAPDPAVGASVQDWPLDVPLATFGGPVLNGTMRCGLVTGADADTLRPSLEAANQLTQWVQDPATSASFGLTVRPIIAGENPCAETFGGG